MKQASPLLFIAALVAIAAIPGSKTPAELQTFSITGHVYDITGNSPVAGATIALTHDSTKKSYSIALTDENGYYAIRNLPVEVIREHRHNLIATHKDYLGKNIIVRVPAVASGQPMLTCNFYLKSVQQLIRERGGRVNLP